MNRNVISIAKVYPGVMLTKNQQTVFDWLNDDLELPVYAQAYKGALDLVKKKSKNGDLNGSDLHPVHLTFNVDLCIISER